MYNCYTCIPETCDICYEYSVAYCPSTIINIPCDNLINGTTYYLWIRDKFDNIWPATTLGLVDGSFDINTTDFPTGMFNPDFGDLDIFLTQDSIGDIAQTMYFIMQEFNCVMFSVNYPVGTPPWFT
jgi:hypothetical protein